MVGYEIVLADDDRLLRKSLTEVLERAGYVVRAVADGEAAVAAVRAARPALVLLDVMMPKMNGLEACRAIRAFDRDVPIVFLTALETEENEIEGLEHGADAYVAKSSSDSVLLARIGVILRRVHADDQIGAFLFGACEVNAADCSLVDGAGRRIGLTDREIGLLRLLRDHPNEALDRDYIKNVFWGTESDIGDKTVAMTLSRLRDKLGADGDRIQSVRGSGYVYRP